MNFQPLGNTGVRLSSVALGTANFGTRWGYGADRKDSEAILNAYAEAGGNFIDTADVYQFGESEEILGQLIEKRRNDFFLATKFSSGSEKRPGILATGNSRRAMVTSLESSLKRLKTDRIDLYWVHHPDNLTPSEELLRGLDDLVRSGKILYAGLSNFSAWRLARAVTLAEITRTIPVVASQFEYSLVHREPEQEMLIACKALGITPVTWSPLGGGMLTGKYRQGEKGRAQGLGGKVFQPENSIQRTNILNCILEIAKENAVTPDKVAINWIIRQNCIPLIGPRTLAQLKSNIDSTSVALTEEQIQRLDNISQRNSNGQSLSAVSPANTPELMMPFPVA